MTVVIPVPIHSGMKLYSIPDAAARLGISRQRLHVLIQTGKARATRIGREFALTATEVARLEQKSRARKARQGAVRHELVRNE